jgi:hypothetical protein
MGYKNKTYICFDGDNDIRYYWLLKAWKHNQTSFFSDFNFYDAHDINNALDSSMVETIKRKLKERLNNSKQLVVLVGSQTRYLYKFVRWELEQAVKMNIPIIVVNLNGMRELDVDNCPPIIRDELAIHISFNQKIIEFALNNWNNSHLQLQAEKKDGPFYYNEKTYKLLGL